MIRMRRGAAVCAAALAMLLAAACGDDVTEPPIPGMLLLSLTTPAPDDDGVLLKVSGPGIQAVGKASSVQEIFWRLASESEARVIVLGGLSSGPLLTLQVPDVRKSAEYSVTVLDVSTVDDAVRDQVSAYQATVKRF